MEQVSNMQLIFHTFSKLYHNVYYINFIRKKSKSNFVYILSLNIATLKQSDSQ